MAFTFDLSWLTWATGSTIAGIFFISFIGSSLLPIRKYDSNKLIRMRKSWLQTWLTWDHPPRLAIGQYVDEGYRKIIKGLEMPFVIPMCGMETTIMPAKYLPLLKQENREELSLCQGFEDMFNMTITSGKDGRHDHVEIDVVAKYINPRLSDFLPSMVAQTDYAFNLELGDADSWKAFSPFDLAASIVYRLTARVLVGEELCRNPAYISSVIQYSMSFLMSGFMWPIRPPHWGPFRKWGYWLGTWKLRRDINSAFEFILPLIHSRVAEMESSAAGVKQKEKYMDMVQGLLEMDLPSPEEGTPIRHAHRVLHLTFAASAVSSALILHTIHQTLNTPQYVPELQEEIERALKQNGGWTEKALLEMTFLDSYIREMLRLCPPSVLTGQRTILSPTFQFDSQLSLPKNTRIAFPALQIHTDPDNYPNPLSFNPYRYVKAGVSAFRIDDKYLSFGYGKQACPGRFLAIRQVKLILAKLFVGYDMQWAGGPKKAPRSLTKQIVEGQIFPDMGTKIELRKRVV